jgi:hypothetical protein
MTPFVEATVDFGENADGLYIVNQQEIPQEFLDDLKSERMARSHFQKHGELNRVASVPEFVWDLWIREGRDPWNATPKQIVGWLERDNLNAFITVKNV